MIKIFVGWKKMKLSFLFSLALASILIVTQYQNCGSAKGKDATKLTVRFPKNTAEGKITLSDASSANQSPGGPTTSFDIWNGDVRAQAQGELNCFGIAVGGPEDSLKTARCEDTSGNPINFGVHNMGALAGETVSLQVDSGSSRVINIFAWRAEDNESCRTLQAGRKVRGSKLSRPLLVGQVVRDLAGGDQVVNVNASFSKATEMIGCSIFTKDPEDGSEQQQGGNIGGTVSGLDPGQQVTLHLLTSQEELVDSISVGNGTFVFGVDLKIGQSGFVRLATFPNNKTCILENESGTFTGEKVEDIRVTCGTGFSVGGLVFGLSPGETLVLHNQFGENELDTLELQGPAFQDGPAITQLSSDLEFAFPQKLPTGISFSVSVASAPEGKECHAFRGDVRSTSEQESPPPSFQPASGVIQNEDVNDIIVVCSEPTFAIRGTIEGYNSNIGEVQLHLHQDLEGGGEGGGAIETITLQDGQTNYQFTTPLPSGFNYRIILQTPFFGSGEPACVFESSGFNSDQTGTISDGDVQVNIVCTQPSA